MLAVVVEFRIEPAFVEAFARAIADNARASLDTERGCRQFDVCRDAEDPQLFFLYELYDDAAAFQVHLRTPHFLQLNTTTAAWVLHKSVRTFERIDP